MIVTKPEWILLDASAKDSTDIIEQLCAMLRQSGCIGKKYCQDVIAREKEYPTGLPSEGVTAAIPHAFSEDVTETAVAIAVLREPVMFRNIADYDEELPVSLVFLLANGTGDGEHMDSLQELMDSMSRPSLLTAVKNAASAEEIRDVLAHAEDYPEADE